MSEQQYLSLSEAGELVGKSRSTMWRAMKAGKMSVDKDHNGQWVVAISELLRVYPDVKQVQRPQTQQVDIHSTGSGVHEHAVATDILQSKVDMLSAERERLLKELSDLRDDMREERQENRHEREKLMALVEQSQKQLTHERDRYDEEIKRARARLKAFTQSQKRPQSANSNKVLREDGQGGNQKSSGKSGFLGWLFGN